MGEYKGGTLMVPYCGFPLQFPSVSPYSVNKGPRPHRYADQIDTLHINHFWSSSFSS